MLNCPMPNSNGQRPRPMTLGLGHWELGLFSDRYHRRRAQAPANGLGHLHVVRRAGRRRRRHAATTAAAAIPGLWGLAPALARARRTTSGSSRSSSAPASSLYALTLDLLAAAASGWAALFSMFVADLTRRCSCSARAARSPVFRVGRWWTVLSAGWLHGGLLHIFFNMMAAAAARARHRGPVRSRAHVIIYVARVGRRLRAELVRRRVPAGPDPLLRGGQFTVGASASICGPDRRRSSPTATAAAAAMARSYAMLERHDAADHGLPVPGHRQLRARRRVRRRLSRGAVSRSAEAGTHRPPGHRRRSAWRRRCCRSWRRSSTACSSSGGRCSGERSQQSSAVVGGICCMLGFIDADARADAGAWRWPTADHGLKRVPGGPEPAADRAGGDVVTHALASLLAGYVLAKLAGQHEVQHAAVAAALQTLLLRPRLRRRTSCCRRSGCAWRCVLDHAAGADRRRVVRAQAR